jgi:hypothetical protein
MVREFWSDDAKFGAGITGFMNWFDAEGEALLGLIPGEEGATTDAFIVADLTEEDIAQLPLDDEIVLSYEDNAEVLGARDLSASAGVVSLAEMDCTWKETEALLLRPDQDTLFSEDFEYYERVTYPDEAAFAAAEAARDFEAIPESIQPYADDFDASLYASTVLFTDNIVDPSSVLGVDLPAYDLNLDMRHGLFEVDGEDIGVLGIVTYNPGAVWNDQGNNGLVQSYSVELNVERPGGKTLRMLAVWAQPASNLIDPDSALSLNYAVSKSRDSSVRLSEICSGEIVID